MAKTAHKLAQNQIIALSKYIEGNKDEFTSGKHNYQTMATKAQKDLSFMITESNVKGILSAIGMRLPVSEAKTKNNPLARVMQENVRLKEIIKEICSKLHSDLGINIDCNI